MARRFRCLFISINLVDPLLCIDHSIHLLLFPLVRVHLSEIDWAPHLISVDLVRAPELVPVVSLVHALEEGVARLETELAVPSVLGVVA